MDKEQVLLAQMLESWKDIRSYGSSIWQVTGLCLAVIGIVIGQILGGTYNGEPILMSFIGVLLFLFAISISIFAITTINWIFGNVITRADMIHQMEARFHNFDFELYSHELDKLSITEGFGFGIIIIFEWKDLPGRLGILFLTISGSAILALQYVWYQLSPTQLGDNLITLFIIFLFILLFYSLNGSFSLRNKYIDVLKRKEFKRIMNNSVAED